ncbi:dicarboxylate/amino acid:cation symporter [candidate division KSB1 bacterium]|nr:dicarboxylate/amino acid:cation symporter [candidate division KSB1 bacterium]
MSLVHKLKSLDMQWKILIAIVLGLTLGLTLNQTVGPNVQEGPFFILKTLFQYGGDIFIRLLRMTIIPLVFASIFMSIVNLGNIRKLKRIGSVTVVYYLTTTALAVLVGMLLVNWIHPGRGIDPAAIEAMQIESVVPESVAAQGVGERSSLLIILDQLVDMIPKNPIQAMAKGNILQLIFYTIFFALIAATLGKEVEPVVRVIEGIDRIMHKFILVIMKIAPYCIFFLVTVLIMDLGFSVLGALGKYALTVLLGLIIHAGITLPILVLVFGKYNPIKLFKAVLPAVLTAWSTASSAATLPITMDCIEKKAGVDRKIGTFVLPLGATVNMDGTALYESVAVIFIAELLGFDLTIGTQMIIFVTATLAAIGAAAIPSAGLVTMGIVLTAAGLPLEGIGLILAIDRILDQFRTAVNVWGDSTAAVVVGRIEGAITELKQD